MPQNTDYANSPSCGIGTAVCVVWLWYWGKRYKVQSSKTACLSTGLTRPQGSWVEPRELELYRNRAELGRNMLHWRPHWTTGNFKNLFWCCPNLCIVCTYARSSVSACVKRRVTICLCDVSFCNSLISFSTCQFVRLLESLSLSDCCNVRSSSFAVLLEKGCQQNLNNEINSMFISNCPTRCDCVQFMIFL